MKMYYERQMKCQCGESQRQTALRIPLDWIGEALDFEQRKDFRRNHKRCNSEVKYTQWIKKEFDL